MLFHRRHEEDEDRPDRGEGLTREQIYDMNAGQEMDRMIEDSFGENGNPDKPRPFSISLNDCFEFIVSGFSWFRLSKNHEDEDFWCEIRIFPKDYEKRRIYFKHIARAKEPALAVCKAYLIYVNKRGNSFGGQDRYESRDRRDRNFDRDNRDRD